MKLRVSCNLRFYMEESSALILVLRPYRGIQQWILRETYIIKPSVPVLESTDSFGNSCQRLIAPQGNFLIHSSAEVITDEQMQTAPGGDFIEIQHLPSDVLPFLLPSRYCESDRLADIAVKIVADAKPGYDQICKIVDWIREHYQYLPGSSNVPLSAMEIKDQNYGVCRDLAHLGIAMCRSISIPARIVTGYLYGLEPMDMHAWFEAYVGRNWYAFDPSQPSLKGGRVVVAFGRDAADVPVFHQFGIGCQLNDMDVKVECLDSYVYSLL